MFATNDLGDWGNTMGRNYFKGAFSGLIQFLATESPLKMMKNAFFSPQKPFLFSRYLNFCLDSLIM